MLNITRKLCVAAMVALVAPAFAAEWMTDLEAAKAKAAAEGKAVLVDFTGSDWCGWCIRLRKDVLDKPAFEEYAKDKFVLMEVDVPRNPEFDPELLRRNRALCEQYKVDGFPTIMVLDSAGKVLGGFVGGRTSVDAVRAPLDEALANAEALKAIDALEGDEKVKAIHALYQKLPEGIREGSGLHEQLAELDVNNLTGVQDEIKAEKQRKDILARFKQAGNDRKAMLAVLDEALKDAYPQNRPMLLDAKIGILLSLAETEEDILAVKKVLLEMADADPDNAAAIRNMAEQQFADPAAMLRRVKQFRKE